MPKQLRTRSISARQVRAYVVKAEEYLAAASSELESGRAIAATSLAIHAAINAADVVTGAPLAKTTIRSSTYLRNPERTVRGREKPRSASSAQVEG